MRSTKKNQQSGGQAEIIAAVKALASEKDISEEMLYNAIEEALKAAYKKKRLPRGKCTHQPERYPGSHHRRGPGIRPQDHHG